MRKEEEKGEFSCFEKSELEKVKQSSRNPESQPRVAQENRWRQVRALFEPRVPFGAAGQFKLGQRWLSGPDTSLLSRRSGAHCRQVAAPLIGQAPVSAALRSHATALDTNLISPRQEIH